MISFHFVNILAFFNTYISSSFFHFSNLTKLLPWPPSAINSFVWMSTEGLLWVRGLYSSLKRQNITKFSPSRCSQSGGDGSHANWQFQWSFIHPWPLLYTFIHSYTLPVKPGETQRIQQWHQLGSTGEWLTFQWFTTIEKVMAKYQCRGQAFQ